MCDNIRELIKSQGLNGRNVMGVVKENGENDV
jgi:hypothetical protein